MRTKPILASSSWPPQAHDAAGDVVGLFETVRATVSMAAKLAACGHRMDVTGLDQTVGALCAKALDLPTPEARAARIHLIELLGEIDLLDSALRPKNPE